MPDSLTLSSFCLIDVHYLFSSSLLINKQVYSKNAALKFLRPEVIDRRSKIRH